MKVNVKVNDKNRVRLYLNLFGGLELKDREKRMLIFFIEEYLTLDDLKEPYRSKLVFHPDTFKKGRELLKMSVQNFSNVKKELISKKTILETEYTHINPLLIPQPEITFNFKMDDHA